MKIKIKKLIKINYIEKPEKKQANLIYNLASLI